MLHGKSSDLNLRKIVSHCLDSNMYFPEQRIQIFWCTIHPEGSSEFFKDIGNFDGNFVNGRR